LAKVTKPFIYGHAHNLFVFAKFLKEKGLEDIEASGIISGGMNLVEWERKEIEQSFNCKVLNRYGCEELSLIASECSHQKGLHLNTDLHYVEILKMSPGDEFGTLIVTDLRNYAMPFIRYRVGDIGAFSETSCSCGRTQPLLKQLQGRESEFIVTPDSRLVSGVSLTDNFAGMIDGIIQLQIIQDKTDHLIFRIVPGESFAVQSLKSIESLVRKFFGEQMTFDCDITDTIPLDSSG